VPQVPGFAWQLVGNKAQSTPALLESLVTVAVRVTVPLIGTGTGCPDAGAAGTVVTEMESVDGGGGGGFCGLKVLLPPHPASTAIAAAGRRERIHRLVATANLLELLHHDLRLHHLPWDPILNLTVRFRISNL